MNPVREYYDSIVEQEWSRMDRHPVEFAITKAYIEKYVRPGERVLDLGGGPGRYSLWLAEKGCDVTLLDLSPANAAFAAQIAEERSLALRTLSGDAMEADSLVEGPFDHVLLMGPLYHLLKEEQRVRAVTACKRLLRPGGTLFASAITSHAGILYYLQNDPAIILDERESTSIAALEAGESYGGPAFTDAYFMRVPEMRPFMEGLGFETMHLVGCEGVCSPREPEIAAQPDLFDRWLRVSLAVCERPEMLGLSEHMLYIGRKQ